jgi:membrane protease YdiL (CAAX protease family)
LLDSGDSEENVEKPKRGVRCYLESFRARVRVPYLSLSLLVLVSTVTVYGAVAEIALAALALSSLLPLLLLASILRERRKPVRQNVPLVPVLAAATWMLIAVPFFNSHVSLTGSLGGLLFYVWTTGIPLMFLVRRDFWGSVGLDPGHLGRNAAPVLFLGGFMSIGLLLSALLHYDQPLSAIRMGSLLTQVAFAPIFEEVLFRGAIQEALTQRLGDYFNAVSITAVLFGLLHVPAYSHLLADSTELALVLIVGPTAAGLVFGYMKALTGSVVPGILTHSAYNTAVFLGSINMSESFLFGAVILALVGLALLIYSRFLQHRVREEGY